MKSMQIFRIGYPILCLNLKMNFLRPFLWPNLNQNILLTLSECSDHFLTTIESNFAITRMKNDNFYTYLTFFRN